MLWLRFILLAAVIVIAGAKLSKYGDVISEKTGIGRGVIGVFFLAAATSMPELVASGTSAFINNANLAIGNLFGANMLNLFIIAVLDFVSERGPISYKLKTDHILSGGFGIILISLALLCILSPLVANQLGIVLPKVGIGHLGFGSVVIFLAYLGGMRLVFRYGRRETISEPKRYEGISTPTSFIRFGLAALLIVIAGIFLSKTADAISEIPIGGVKIGGTFVGSIMLALATTLPELVVSLAAVKMNLYDMAIGNLLGSVMFNTAIIFFADLLYRGGAILQGVAATHLVSGLFAIVGIIFVIVGLVYRSRRAILRLGWDALGITVLYFTWAVILFNLR